MEKDISFKGQRILIEHGDFTDLKILNRNMVGRWIAVCTEFKNKIHRFIHIL